jgi:hypothetical protein
MLRYLQTRGLVLVFLEPDLPDSIMAVEQELKHEAIQQKDVYLKKERRRG